MAIYTLYTIVHNEELGTCLYNHSSWSTDLVFRKRIIGVLIGFKGNLRSLFSYYSHYYSGKVVPPQWVLHRY